MERKIYPNEPCPCGSGKKYKHCCAKNPKGKNSEDKVEIYFCSPYLAKGRVGISLDAQNAEYLLYALGVKTETYKNCKAFYLDSIVFEKLLKIAAIDFLNSNQAKTILDLDLDLDNLVMRGIENGKIISSFASKEPLTYVKDDNAKSGIIVSSCEEMSEIDEFEHEKQMKALGIGIEEAVNTFVCNSEKNQVDYIKKLLNEDVSFLRFLIKDIFGNYDEDKDYQKYEDKSFSGNDFWKEVKKFVSDDTFGTLKKWKFFNEVFDYNNIVLAPYDHKLKITNEYKDLYSEFKCGKISVFQTAVFHEYLLKYLCKRFTDYRFLPQNILRNDNFLSTVFHRGFDVLLAITINIELQMGVHMVFQNAERKIPNMVSDDRAWFKKIARGCTFYYYNFLPDGLHLLLNSYLGIIDQIMEDYDPYAEFNCVYRNSHEMYEEELESLAEIIYMNLPQGNGYFLDYKNALRALCAGLLCGSVDVRSKLFRLSLQLCTHMDYVKLFLGIEKSEMIFNSKKNATMSNADLVKVYHEAVFYLFDEKNGINHGIYPKELKYVDDIRYDALLRKDGFWLKNPSIREQYYYDYRHLRVELFEMLSGTCFAWREKDDSIKGLYPLLPFYMEKPLKFNVKGDEGEHIRSQRLETIEKVEDRLFYLGYIREIDEIPIASFREYMIAPVFYSWLKQREAMKIIELKNKKLKEANDNLKKQMEMNYDLVRNIAHSAVNYLNTERLANTGVVLHEARNDDPTLDELHTDGLLLMLQSEQEEYLIRQLKDAVRKYKADISEEEKKAKEIILEGRIRSSISKTTGMSLEDVVGFALQTVVARILFRRNDEKAQYIKSKLYKTESDWTNIKSTFMTDVLASGKGTAAFDWWLKNWNTIELKVSEMWKKIRFIKNGDFYDLILEIITELIINSLVHGEVKSGIVIEFGQENNEKGRPLWAFISLKNKIGDECKIKSGVGLASLNNDIVLINHGERPMVYGETEGFYETKVWLHKKLLVTKVGD